MDAATLAVQASSGFVVGALVGYAVRKVTGFIATLATTFLGLWLLSFVALAQLGVVSVNWGALGALVALLLSALSGFLSWLGVSTQSVYDFLASSGAFGVGLTLGALVGSGLLHSAGGACREYRFVRRRT